MGGGTERRGYLATMAPTGLMILFPNTLLHSVTQRLTAIYEMDTGESITIYGRAKMRHGQFSLRMNFIKSLILTFNL